MPKMTEDEIFAFIAEKPRTAKLATVRRDGSPHVVPVWVAVDGRQLVFNAGADTLKGKSMRRDPRVSLCFDDEEPPFAFVSIDGTVTLEDDLEAMLPWSTAIAARYMGEEQAEAYGRRNAVEGELLVRVTPTRMIGQSGVAD